MRDAAGKEEKRMTVSSYAIAKYPNPLKLATLLKRKAEPLVMVNLIKYKQRASGKFKHMTGEEAYIQYAESAMNAQGSMGINSRIIWSGRVDEQVAGKQAPQFDSIGFLEYASPQNFFKFLLKGKSDQQARSSGLSGQWLLASKTITETQVDDYEDDVVLVELFSHIRREADTWLVNWQAKQKEFGGQIIWQGNSDTLIIGRANKKPTIVVATRYPNVGALTSAMATSEASRIKRSEISGVRDYMAFRAHSDSKMDTFADILEQTSA